MGQLLSHPIEDKSLLTVPLSTLTYSVGAMQGYRMSMEDAHEVKVNEDESLAVFGVFDGHGGKEIAQIVSEKLTQAVFSRLNQEISRGRDEEGGGSPLSRYIRVIKDSFFYIDRTLPAGEGAHCGTTALVATVIDKKYIVLANTGDSRGIMSLNGGSCKTLSFDHKPSNMGERVRIENSGGYVVNGRVNEILALSRAFGDFKFKIPFMELSDSHNKYVEKNKQYFKNDLVHLPPELLQVTSEPEVLVYDLSALTAPEFLVLACDGIWDCYRNDQLIKVIRDKLALDWSLEHITEFILNDCISMASNITGIGFDNMTLIIVALHSSEGDIDDWYRKMKAKILAEKKVH